jgi:hypothetical protein
VIKPKTTNAVFVAITYSTTGEKKKGNDTHLHDQSVFS